MLACYFLLCYIVIQLYETISVCHPDLIASKLVLWEPMHGKATRGARRKTRVCAEGGDADELPALECWTGICGDLSRVRVAPVYST